jgi:hypothetical protein
MNRRIIVELSRSPVAMGTAGSDFDSSRRSPIYIFTPDTAGLSEALELWKGDNKWRT